MATTALDAFERDAQIAGIGGERSLHAVQRRRSQLFVVMVMVLVALCVATAITPTGNESGPVDPGVLRLGLILVSASFVIYAIEKERALRRLEAALAEDELALEALGLETERLHRLVNAGHALSASLELDRVVDLSLTSALRLFDAPSGAVFLDRGDLVIQAAKGERQRLDLADRRAREVAATFRPALFPPALFPTDEPGEPAEPGGRGDPAGMAAPLLHDGDLLGVLVVHGDGETGFSNSDLKVLAAFARAAAAAIANARLFRAEQTVNEQFAGLRHDLQAEFDWLVAG